MSLFPLINISGVKGSTTIYNFSPNNWELRHIRDQWVSVLFVDNNEWVIENLGKLPADSMRTFTTQSLSQLASSKSLVLFSLTRKPIHDQRCNFLPEFCNYKTNSPVWRATVTLSSDFMQTSYQGEIDPFPQSGSLLTFGPFLQYGKFVENFLIFLNLEKKAITRTGNLYIYDAKKLKLRKTFIVQNNSANVIPLDDTELVECDLPLIVCRDMAGIPLYFSRTTEGSFMSLEHSHPPASFVIHGKRWGVQQLIKNLWFSEIFK